MANSGNKDPPALPPGGRCGRGVSSSSFCPRPRRFVLILVVLVVLVVSSSSFRPRRSESEDSVSSSVNYTTLTMTTDLYKLSIWQWASFDTLYNPVCWDCMWILWIEEDRSNTIAVVLLVLVVLVKFQVTRSANYTPLTITTDSYKISIWQWASFDTLYNCVCWGWTWILVVLVALVSLVALVEFQVTRSVNYTPLSITTNHTKYLIWQWESFDSVEIECEFSGQMNFQDGPSSLFRIRSFIIQLCELHSSNNDNWFIQNIYLTMGVFQYTV
jgi:hypothetical protein